MKKDIKQLEDLAEANFSNYTGTDFNDEYDFGGAPGFGHEEKSNLRYSVKLTNTGANAVDRVIALNPGQFESEADLNTAGYTIAGILRDGQVVPSPATGAEVVGTPQNPRRTIKEFLKFCRANATRVVGMIIQSDDPEQFSTYLNISQYSPFKELGKDFVALEDYYDPDQFSSKKINVPLVAAGQAFQFDDQTIVDMTLKAGRTANITFICGAVDNRARKLAKRAKRAYAGTDLAIESMKVL
jgi:hypothetical protein